jgi:hypothetical protein
MNKIKIPKYDDEDLVEVEINRTGIIETRRGAMRVTLKKQTLLGVEIKHGCDVWVPGGVVIRNEFSQSPKAYIKGKFINQIIKGTIIGQLKNKKQ